MKKFSLIARQCIPKFFRTARVLVSPKKKFRNLPGKMKIIQPER
jgi:hypothetical protein